METRVGPFKFLPTMFLADIVTVKLILKDVMVIIEKSK